MFFHCRPRFLRSAVAFFNMKHFQYKHSAKLSPENIYATLKDSLSPRDRLLRQSALGRGASRVLILDHKQKVKGVYVPIYCLPHPSTVSGSDNSLGVTVESYLKVIEPLAHFSDKHDSTSAAMDRGVMPTVLAVVAHPRGIAYGIFYADGTPALPVVNTHLSSRDSIAQGDKNLGFGQPIEFAPQADSLWPVLDEFNSMLAKDRESVSRCSTFYWIMRDENESLSLKSLRSCERLLKNVDLVQEGVTTASPIHTLPANAVISFEDRRWTVLQDTFFEVSQSRTLYTRDPATHQRIVNPEGLRTVMQSGMLLLDYVPMAVKNASPSAAGLAGVTKKA